MVHCWNLWNICVLQNERIRSMTMGCTGCKKEFDPDAKDAVGYCGCGLCEGYNNRWGDPLFCTVKCHDSYYAGEADAIYDRALDDLQIERAEKEGKLK